MKKLITLLLSVAVGFSSVNAQEYNLHIPDFNDYAYCDNVICEGVGCPGMTQAIQNDIINRNNEIKVNYLNLNFNEVTNKLIVEAEIDTTKAKVANVFHLVLTDGSLDVGTKNCEGSVGHLYIDFTDEANPKVTVYAFNGHLNLYCNNGEIHQTKSIAHNGYDDTYTGLPTDVTGPYVNKASHKQSFYAKNAPVLLEKIFSSVNSPSAVKFSIDDTATSKIVNLELDTTLINNHVLNPILLQNKSYTYEGIKFAEHIGVWFWAAANATASYSGSYLSQLVTDKTSCSTCTKPDHETKSKVLCGESSVTANPVLVGKSTTLSFDVINKDYFDTEKAPVLVSYTGLPTGAKPNVPAGEEVIFAEDGQNGKATINIEWTPTEDQVGDYTIGANFLVEYGLNNLQTNCAGVKVKVNPIVPECKQADLTAITQADQDMAQLNLIASQLEQRIKRVRKQIGGKAKVDSFDPHQENIRGWQSYNAIVGNGVYLFQCTNIDSCAGDLQVSSLNSDLDTFNTSIENLKNIALSRSNKLRKALVKLNVKKGLDLATARRRAQKVVQNQYLQGTSNQGINPVYNSATSFVNLHVSSYGLTRFSAASIEAVKQSCGLTVVK